MTRTLSLHDVRARSLEELLRDVAAGDDVLRIEVSEGDVVELRRVGKLLPMITFDGYVPQGWKDAIYPER